ncbi:MAK10-like protein [Tanacetum coccineum]
MLDKYVESLELGKNGSAFIQGEVSAKMEDPGLFTLPCRLGDSKPFDTLADLGSCVNIIPLYLFKKLNIRLLEETDYIFGLADGTKSYPIGIVKDVEVRIGKLKLLNDFYVIDIKKDSETPLLVGRGFLAIANVVIDCRKAKISVGEGITSILHGFNKVVRKKPLLNHKISSQIQNAIDNAIPSLVDASVDPLLQQQDITIGLALQMKFEKTQVPHTAYRPSSICLRDHDDPHDDAHPKGENSAKRQKTSEYEAYVSGESSSRQVNVEEPGPSTSGNQEQDDEFDFWTDSYASDDDEIKVRLNYRDQMRR